MSLIVWSSYTYCMIISKDLTTWSTSWSCTFVVILKGSLAAKACELSCVMTGYQFCKKKKKKNYLFVTYIIIQSISSSEMCSLYLTHPSTHTPGAVDTHTRTHTHTHTHTHLEQWTHTHTHLEQWTHTHTHTHTWSSGHTHTHTHTYTHTHTPGAVGTHAHTHTLGAVDTVHSGEAPARPPHVTLYKIHSFETRWIILTFTIESLFHQ